MKRFPHAAVLLATVAAVAAARAATPADVLTYHNDPARTGQQLAETQLTPATVNAAGFGKRFAYPVDGQVYAQPLYVGGVTVAGRGRRNVVLVATEHDGVYLFDADGGGLLWQRSFLDPANGVTSVPFQDVFGCGQITPELGVTGTPVIDPATGTAYLVAMTREAAPGGATTPRYVHRLHALDLATGNERPGSPVEVQASVPGTGDGGAVVDFLPRNYKQRPGLALVNGVVYTAWSSHCDAGTYHGWLLGYAAASLRQVSVFNNTPDGQEASYWSSGAAPAVDAAGSLYLVAGNGTFDPPADPAAIPRNVGAGVLRLSTTAAGDAAPADYFAPFNYDDLNRRDADLGSSGALLYDAPNGRRLLTTAGKEGRIYVLDRDGLGRFQPGSDSQIVQSLPTGANALAGPLFSCPAYWNGTVYFSAVNDALKAFRLNADGTLPGAPTTRAPLTFGYPGSVPSLSANGATAGIVWAFRTPGVLHAFDAADVSRPLYDSAQAANDRDAAGSYVKFTVPTVAQGRVYVGTANALVGYGLLNPAAAADVSGGVRVDAGPFLPQTAAGGAAGRSKQVVTLTNVGADPLAGPLTLVLDRLKDPAATLRNAAGSTTVAGRPGSPYVNVTPPGSVLAPGASVTVKLKFLNPNLNGSLRYRTRVLAGAGAR